LGISSYIIDLDKERIIELRNCISIGRILTLNPKFPKDSPKLRKE